MDEHVSQSEFDNSIFLEVSQSIDADTSSQTLRENAPQSAEASAETFTEVPLLQEQGQQLEFTAVSSSDSLPPTLVSPISRTIHSAVSQRAHPRIFLGLCVGYDRPLSQALRHLEMDVLSIDKLISLEHDLLDIDFCESILRLCASGVVGYTACSPSCNLYSRLRLRPGGPPALRAPEHLNGIPGISPAYLEKVQLSAALLHVCVDCLLVNYASGSHGHLEQPSTAMSWSEPAVQHWILQASCKCINLPACKFGLDLHKQWMFATHLFLSCSHWVVSVNILKDLIRT